MTSLRHGVLTLTMCVAVFSSGPTAMRSPAQIPSTGRVTVLRTPNGGIQPQVAVDGNGDVHLLYFKGEAAHGDLFYVRVDDGGHFSDPIRVNSLPGSALATGSVRGGHIVVGRHGRVHVAWHGSDRSGGATAVLYTRQNGDGTGFEPEQNVARFTTGIDGAAIAADRSGHVYVVWHGGEPGVTDEGARRVWIAQSSNDGDTFGREAAASESATGACGCCGVAALADRSGALYVLYRSAREIVHRDTFLLISRDQGARFASQKLQDWNLGACPMSTFSLSESSTGVLAAWETAGQVYWTAVDLLIGHDSSPLAAPGSTNDRKHPVVARNVRGETLLAWTEGTGWNRGGSVAWQLYDSTGRATAERSRLPGVPTWSFVAIAPTLHGFTIIY